LPKKLFQFSCGCEQFHLGMSFGFLVINVCNYREDYETPCIIPCGGFITPLAAVKYVELNPWSLSFVTSCKIRFVPLLALGIKHETARFNC
jgi:hypothetical protein